MSSTIDLSSPDSGATLRCMAGAVIYIRVSTKEQTENLSLPTQPYEQGQVHFLVVFNLTRFARDKYDHFATEGIAFDGRDLVRTAATAPAFSYLQPVAVGK
jgi:hypothetical protein